MADAWALPDLVAKLRIDISQLTTSAAAIDATLKKIDTSAASSGTAVNSVTKEATSLGTKFESVANTSVTKLFSGITSGTSTASKSVSGLGSLISSAFQKGTSDARTALQGLTSDLAKLSPTGGGGVFSSLLGGVSGLGSSIPVIGTLLAGVTGLGAGLEHLVNETAQYSAQVERNSQYLGMNTDLYQTLSRAVGMFGQSQQSMTLILERFNRTVEAGGPTLKQLGFTLADIGLSQQADINTNLMAFADWLQKSTDRAQSLAVATALFGRGGTQIVEVLQHGSAFIQGYEQELKSYGVILGQTDLQQGAMAASTRNLFGMALQGLEYSVVVPLEKAFTELWMVIGQGAKDSQGHLSGLTNFLSAVVSDIASFISGLTGIKITTDSLKSATTDYNAALQGQADLNQASTDTTTGTTAANKDAKTALDALTKSTQLQTKAIDDQISDLQLQQKQYDKNLSDQITGAQQIQTAFDDQVKMQELQLQLTDEQGTSTLALLQAQLKSVQDTYTDQRKAGESEADYEQRMKEESLQDQITTEQNKRDQNKTTTEIQQEQLREQTQAITDQLNDQKQAYDDATQNQITNLQTQKEALATTLQDAQSKYNDLVAAATDAGNTADASLTDGFDTGNTNATSALDSLQVTVNDKAVSIGQDLSNIFSGGGTSGMLATALKLGEDLGGAIADGLTGAFGKKIEDTALNIPILGSLIGDVSQIAGLVTGQTDQIEKSWYDALGRDTTSASLSEFQSSLTDNLQTLSAVTGTDWTDQLESDFKKRIATLIASAQQTLKTMLAVPQTAELQAEEKGVQDQITSLTAFQATVGRAGGGNVFGGQSYTVGEQGREILTMPAGTSGTITPAASVPSGGNNINVYVTTNADPHAIASEIAWALR